MSQCALTCLRKKSEFLQSQETLESRNSRCNLERNFRNSTGLKVQTPLHENYECALLLGTWVNNSKLVTWSKKYLSVREKNVRNQKETICISHPKELRRRYFNHNLLISKSLNSANNKILFAQKQCEVSIASLFLIVREFLQNLNLPWWSGLDLNLPGLNPTEDRYN